MRAAFARRNGPARRARQLGSRNRSLAAKNLVARHRELLDMLTPVQMEYLETQFLEFADEDIKLLPAKKLAPLLRHLGDHITSLETKQLIALTDADGNGQLDLEELISVLAIRATHKHTESEMIGAFELFDPDKSGSIPVPYFRTTLRSMLPPEVTDDDLEEMLIDGLGGWERVEAEGLFVPMVAAAGPDMPAAPATAPALAAAASASSAHSRSSSHASAAATAAGTAKHRIASPVRGRARQGSTGGGPPERKQGSQRREASSEDSDEQAAREGFWSYEHMFVEYKPWLKRLLSL